MNCGSPNYSNIVMDTPLSSLCSSNMFDTLNSSDCDPSDPIMTSIPSKAIPSKRKKPLVSFTILNINFQSVRNKLGQLTHLLESTKPDIVAGTETWLTNDIFDSEIAPKSLGYSLFRRDRKSGKGGGVLLLVKDNIICSEQPQLSTDCEILWVKVETVGQKPLYIACYYRPKESDRQSIEELNRSLSLARAHNAENMWILGDFNLPQFSWENMLPIIKSSCKFNAIYEDFKTIMFDYNLSQIVDFPTRSDNTLDLVLLSNPTLLNKVISIPGLSDHEGVLADINMRPKHQGQ